MPKAVKPRSDVNIDSGKEAEMRRGMTTVQHSRLLEK
jgi:hypothetical protein